MFLVCSMFGIDEVNDTAPHSFPELFFKTSFNSSDCSQKFWYFNGQIK